MLAGADLFFAQDDNRSTGEVVHRMRVRVREIGPARLVVEAENVSAVRYLLVPLAGPGDLRWVHFFERRSAAESGYFGLARVGAGVSPLLEGHRAST
jgi:hypothetical protein